MPVADCRIADAVFQLLNVLGQQQHQPFAAWDRHAVSRWWNWWETYLHPGSNAFEVFLAGCSENSYFIGMKVACEQFVYDGSNSDSTYEFWILNFQFEVFYDLGKHYNISESQADSKPVSLDLSEKENTGRLELNDLPTEMLSRIFSECTAVDLLVVRSVCTRWQQLIQLDKALWNHVAFSAVDLDVKTTVSLLKEMPLVRTVYLCDVYSSDDMRLLVMALCHDCWELHCVHFPEYCQIHPSARDLHDLSYYQPRIESLELCTKQKLTAAEISNIGQVLAQFSNLKRLKLEGFYWYQPQLMTDLFANICNLEELELSTLPGLNGEQINQLSSLQPLLEVLCINTSSLSANYIHFSKFKHLKKIEIIDSSPMTNTKLEQFNKVANLISLNINLSNSKKEHVLKFFKTHRPQLQYLTVSNCEYSNEILELIAESCPGILSLIWLNPKDASGEVTDSGILAVTKLHFLRRLEIKSRLVSKAHYPDLAKMKSLKYARINGMRVPGCS